MTERKREMVEVRYSRSEVPPLAAGDAHIWLSDLGAGEEAQQRFRNTLGADEIARAEKFRFQRHRRRFIVRRGILREILTHYLDIAPTDVRFRTTRYGKPELDLERPTHGLRFNLSHSGERALVGITRGREIGVDIERIVPGRAEREIAARFFSPGEVAALEQLTGRHRVDAFFRCWTRKEAYVKARGEGLSFPLDRFEVPITPDPAPDSLMVEGDPEESRRWRLECIPVSDDYAAAMFLERPGGRVARLVWRSHS